MSAIVNMPNPWLNNFEIGSTTTSETTVASIARRHADCQDFLAKVRRNRHEARIPPTTATKDGERP